MWVATRVLRSWLRCARAEKRAAPLPPSLAGGTNLHKKVSDRAKRRNVAQGKRSYLHAMVNSMARRASEQATKGGMPKKTLDDSASDV